MALKRETRSLSIGGMPYVRPTNPVGDFARMVQRDSARELDELYAEEDRITVAESVASVYDRAKEIQISQEGVPNSAAMADELGKYTRKMLRGVNSNVQSQLKAQLPGIISPIVNSTVDREVKYNIQQNIIGIEDELETTRRITFDSIKDNWSDVNFQNDYYAKLNALEKRYATASQGTISEQRIRKQFAGRRTEFAAYITAQQYAQIAMTQGTEAAETMLTARAEDFANQYITQDTFEKQVQSVLKQSDLSAKIAKGHAKYIRDFTNQNLGQQVTSLPDAENILPPRLFEKLADKVNGDLRIERANDKFSEFRRMAIEAQQTWTTPEDINEFFGQYRDKFRGAESGRFETLYAQAYEKHFKDIARAQKGRVDLAALKTRVTDMEGFSRDAESGRITEVPATYSDGTDISKGDATTLQKKITARATGERNHNAIITGTRSPEAKDKEWWQAESRRKVNAAIEEGVFKDPARAAEFFRNNKDEWKYYNVLPTAILDLFDPRKDAETLRAMSKLKMDIEQYNTEEAAFGRTITLPTDVGVAALFEAIDPTMDIAEINDIRAKLLATPNQTIEKASKDADTLIAEVNDEGQNIVQQVLHEMGEKGLIDTFARGLFNSLLGHSKTGAYDFFAEMNSNLHLVKDGLDQLSVWRALTAGLDSTGIVMTEQSRKHLTKALRREFLTIGKDNLTSKGAIRSVLNKLGGKDGKLGFSSNIYQKDQNNLHLHYVPPEQVLKDDKGNQISGKQIAIAMIERADQIVKAQDLLTTTGGQKFSDRLYPATSQYRRGRDNKIDGKGELDLGLLYKAGRLKLINGQQTAGIGGKMQTTYEMVIIDESGNLHKLFVPNRGPRINFTNAYEIQQTDASRAILARGRGIGDAAIDTEFGDTFGGGTAGEVSGRRLDAIAKNRPIKRGFGLTETNEPTDMQ